jgi:multidrug efflux pump subunit AcrA (membrane-fusion protein)
MTKHLRATLAVILAISSVSLQAQTSTSPTPKKARHARETKESATEREIRELREQMQSQQAQINALKQENEDKDAKLRETQQSAQGAEAAAESATAKADSLSTSVSTNNADVEALKSSVSDLKETNVGLAQTISDTKKDINEAIESPMAIRYKGVTITPVAFFAAEGVWRQRSLNSDINTPFNSTPYPGAAQANVTELNFSGRQSRLGALFQAKPGSFHFAGYVEADFLSAGATSNDNQSNSYTLRQRQIWGQAGTDSGFTVTGGQMWSLVTETKTSTDNRTEVLPADIDAQYNVGFSWERQPGIRFQQKFGHFTGALSLENAQIVYSATNANPNFFIGNAGAGGGLYNVTANYSNNVAPDVILKATYDAPHFGHYEIGGLARFFRDRYYPNQTSTPASAAGGTNDTKDGGGLFANARFPVTHFADIGVHFLGGTGVGRYGTSTLPDVTVHPDGTLAPIKGYQGLLSVELHPEKKLDLDFYYGDEYAQRTVYLSTVGADAGKLVGYAPLSSSNAGCGIETLPTSTGNGFAGAAPYNPGTPANCLGATRMVTETTAEFVYRFYNSPKYGRLQYSMQYSYLSRNGWAGLTSGTFGSPIATYGSPKATNSMVFTSMRYYIP